jgi:hypothetical protein
MLVHFDSSVGAFTMQGDVAVALLKLMGHSGTVPSAVLAADIPAALARLRENLPHAPPPPAAGDEDDERDVVPLQRRAVPLIALLENAARDGADVLWDKV